MSKECSEFAQSHFVEKRQEEAKAKTENEESQIKTDQAAFMHWLNLSRYVAISQGSTKMEIEHFKKALDLEDTREARTQKPQQTV